MFGSWKKILEYLEMVFELLTQSKAELEQLKLIYNLIASQNITMNNIEQEVELIRERMDEKER